MKILPVRIPFGSAFWRIFLLAAVISEYQLWNRLGPGFCNRGAGFHVAAMIFKSPKVLFTSFFIAAVVTVLLDAFVRVVLGPILARWYSPRRRDEGFGSPLSFHLGSSESILSEMPAQRANGRRCPAG